MFFVFSDLKKESTFEINHNTVLGKNGDNQRQKDFGSVCSLDVEIQRKNQR